MSDTLRATAERHARSLEVTAAAMEKDGFGLHRDTGHVIALRKMADGLRTDAANGRVPFSVNSYGMDAPHMHAAADEPVPAAVREKWGSDVT